MNVAFLCSLHVAPLNTAIGVRRLFRRSSFQVSQWWRVRRTVAEYSLKKGRKVKIVPPCAFPEWNGDRRFLSNNEEVKKVRFQNILEQNVSQIANNDYNPDYCDYYYDLW